MGAENKQQPEKIDGGMKHDGKGFRTEDGGQVRWCQNLSTRHESARTHYPSSDVGRKRCRRRGVTAGKEILGVDMNLTVNLMCFTI